MCKKDKTVCSRNRLTMGMEEKGKDERTNIQKSEYDDEVAAALLFSVSLSGCNGNQG